ncbi:hypothetical protein [Nonomuraea cavernae]|uniref:hypothetical protein n=1 Tax=Nonomuraea cavernae TaxID=2045107 RepID=UPI0033F98BA7
MSRLVGLIGGQECESQVESCGHGPAWPWRAVGRRLQPGQTPREYGTADGSPSQDKVVAV